MSLAPKLRVRFLGCVKYHAALQLQMRMAEKLATDPTAENTVLLLEHYPVYTGGRRLKKSPMLESEEARLTGLGADFAILSRGGDMTFHGPGQLVGYPIVRIDDFKEKVPKLSDYMHAIEHGTAKTCSDLGIKEPLTTDHDAAGVWLDYEGVRARKICAVGVHVGKNNVASHGFALNCNTNLDWFNHIVPCGIMNKGVTSLSQELGSNVTIIDTLDAAINGLADALGVSPSNITRENSHKDVEWVTVPERFYPKTPSLRAQMEHKGLK
eukprot:Clim_evm23s44 gene=Clim_evmTU23s44